MQNACIITCRVCLSLSHAPTAITRTRPQTHVAHLAALPRQCKCCQRPKAPHINMQYACILALLSVSRSQSRLNGHPQAHGQRHTSGTHGGIKQAVTPEHSGLYQHAQRMHHHCPDINMHKACIITCRVCLCRAPLCYSTDVVSTRIHSTCIQTPPQHTKGSGHEAARNSSLHKHKP
jgi:hypothetical protein